MQGSEAAERLADSEKSMNVIFINGSWENTSFCSLRYFCKEKEKRKRCFQFCGFKTTITMTKSEETRQCVFLEKNTPLTGGLTLCFLYGQIFRRFNSNFARAEKYGLYFLRMENTFCMICDEP